MSKEHNNKWKFGGVDYQSSIMKQNENENGTLEGYCLSVYLINVNHTICKSPLINVTRG